MKRSSSSAKDPAALSLLLDEGRDPTPPPVVPIARVGQPFTVATAIRSRCQFLVAPHLSPPPRTHPHITQNLMFAFDHDLAGISLAADSALHCDDWLLGTIVTAAAMDLQLSARNRQCDSSTNGLRIELPR